MRRFYAFWVIVFSCLQLTQTAFAQELTFTTVTREPFSMIENRVNTGFSVDLLSEIAKVMDRPIKLEREDSFGAMLDAVQAGRVDGAIANISITAAREEVMDFTLPIFASGVQVMLHDDNKGGSLLRTLFTLEIGLAILGVFGVLFGCGVLMWTFERARQEYFDRPFREALFPSFWWALNLVVNGGFEERMPRSPLGRLFGVIMVISSLFVVSIFVAYITAATTVDALQSNVQSVNDLDGRRVGTIANSTSAAFLDSRSVEFIAYTSPADMLEGFEDNVLDAVVFDAPILAYYVRTKAKGDARLLDRVFKPENYGIALPADSPFREEINRSILQLRENGVYDGLVRKWFGNAF